MRVKMNSRICYGTAEVCQIVGISKSTPLRGIRQIQEYRGEK